MEMKAKGRMISKFVVLGLVGGLELGSTSALAQDGNAATAAASEKVEKAAGAEGTEAPKKKPLVVGAAQLLPSRVMRFRYVNNSVSSASGGYDKDGNKDDIGLEVKTKVSAYVFEYGITDRLSFQALVPTITSDKSEINRGRLLSSKAATAKAAELAGKASALFQAGIKAQFAKGGDTTCASAQCKGTVAAYAPEKILDGTAVFPSNGAIPSGTTGETIPFTAGGNIKNAIDDLIYNGSKLSSGKTGPSDIEVGLGYMAYTDTNQILTFGLGVKLPTGAHDKPSAYRAPGKGFNQVGFLAFYDYRIHDGLVASVYNRSEAMLGKATYHRSSVADNTQFNSADPCATNAALGGALGDCKDNAYTLERKGIRNNGYVKLTGSLGMIHSVVNPVGFNLALNWNYEPAYKGHPEANNSVNFKNSSQSTTYGIFLSGLNMEPRLPIDIEYNRTVVTKGVNIKTSAQQDEVQLKLYYKF